MSGRRPRGRRRNRNKPSSKQQRAFWGDEEKLPNFGGTVRITNDATAVVASLGRVPLSGSETIAEHYFEAVLERSVGLGSALAAAGGLVEADDLVD
jgi:hypothetical protein